MEKGHWYTDENGNHYFVKEGQSPKEGWEATKRRKMINGGKYQTSEDGKNWKDSTRDEYEKYEADEMEFDNDNEEELNNKENDNYFEDSLGRNNYYGSKEDIVNDYKKGSLTKNRASEIAKQLGFDGLEFGDDKEEKTERYKIQKDKYGFYNVYDMNGEFISDAETIEEAREIGEDAWKENPNPSKKYYVGAAKMDLDSIKDKFKGFKIQKDKFNGEDTYSLVPETGGPSFGIKDKELIEVLGGEGAIIGDEDYNDIIGVIDTGEQLHSFLNKIKENKSNSDKVSVNGKMTPSDAQKMSANLEKELKEIFPGKIVTVGYDIKGDNTTFDYKVNGLGGKSQSDNDESYNDVRKEMYDSGFSSEEVENHIKHLRSQKTGIDYGNLFTEDIDMFNDAIKKHLDPGKIKSVNYMNEDPDGYDGGYEVRMKDGSVQRFGWKQYDYNNYGKLWKIDDSKRELSDKDEDILQYSNDLEDLEGQFDVASPQEVANLMGKKVKTPEGDTFSPQKLGHLEDEWKSLGEYRKNPNRNLNNIGNTLHKLKNHAQHILQDRFDYTNITSEDADEVEDLTNQIEKEMENRMESVNGFSNKEIEVFGHIYAIKKMLEKAKFKKNK